MGQPPKAELLRALGRVVRGLSALFWGIPLTLVVYIETARTDWLSYFGAFAIIPSLVGSIILSYALLQFRHFQKQERIWQTALNRAEIFALVNIGLSPFLFWWHRFPEVQFYQVCLALLALSSLVLLTCINQVLNRLTAMLPDEMLRSETRMFTSFNILILNSVFVLVCLYFVLSRFHSLPYFLHRAMTLVSLEGIWLATFLILMPLAMTMSMIWKIKEVIFSSVFDAEH